MKKTIKAFCQHSNVDSNLIKAVIRQSGGWRDFQENAPYIANNGVAGGFSGWIYYTETGEFYAKNQQLISNLVESQADEYGYQSAQELVKRCGKLDSTMSEIGYTLFGTKRQHANYVANALAWYAAEEVARAYTDWIYEECHK